jgi:hypothetical protein
MGRRRLRSKSGEPVGFPAGEVVGLDHTLT